MVSIIMITESRTMGRKNAGGNKAKKQGRKHTGGGGPRGVRFIEEEGEIYACVTKLYGGGVCGVMCADGVERMCVIRKKFRGRGKRDNNIAGGVWVLVGIRDWEVRAVGKAQKCDLLEVYSQADKDKLKGNASVDLRALVKAACDTTGEVAEDTSDGFDFVDDKTAHYAAVLEEEAAKKAGTNVVVNDGSVEDKQLDWVDIDDI
jgi:initiation factor 1A